MGWQTKPSEIRYIDYRPAGAVKTLFSDRSDEVLVSGPAGTGKSRGCLERCNAIAEKYPGSRGLIARKTRASLTNTTLVTFEQLVLLPDLADKMTYRGLDYPNGSRIDFGGLDKSSRIMSSEYDWVFVPEATELVEADWESLTTRLRWNHVPYQQLVGDCNPGPPSHFLKRRANAGKLRMLESRHEDNPKLFDPRTQQMKPDGAKYLTKLDNLTGARYLRLRKGIWAAAEGMVYTDWDASIHLINREREDGTPVIKPHWTRIWTVDFGYTNPFVWQAWAVDPDGRMYRYREIYMTQRLVEDHARTIRELCKRENEPPPDAIVCDHDAEDRATFERHLKLFTVPAYKIISPGIQAVQRRLRRDGTGRPRIMLLRDSLVERDQELSDAGKPVCTDEEIENYVWPTPGSAKAEARPKDEVPVKKDDHGMDGMRYAAAAVDRIWDDPASAPAELRIGNLGDFQISRY